MKISHIDRVYSIASIVKNHRLYPDFLKVKERLAANQFVCWIAGGAVRDFCLGREVAEFDLVTDASTEALKLMFPEAVLVGESFGVLKIPLPNNEFFDLAGFREEADYTDGRRPSTVRSSTPTQDAHRRDFSINAMYWNDELQCIVDEQGGQLDLKQKRLRCVGIPDVRFGEDFLRILRLARFSVQLGFSVEPSTEAAAIAYLQNLQKVSGERIWAEIKKADMAHAWGLAVGQKLFRQILCFIFELAEPLPAASVFGDASLFLFLNLLAPKTDLSGLLKDRLKLSNAEIKNYQMLRFLLLNSEKLSTGELAFELEKSDALREHFQYLVKMTLLDSAVDEKIQNAFRKHSELLITAKDLMDLIPAKNISEELKLIRIGQLDADFGSKTQVLAYLKKKYAN